MRVRVLLGQCLVFSQTVVSGCPGAFSLDGSVLANRLGILPAASSTMPFVSVIMLTIVLILPRVGLPSGWLQLPLLRSCR